MAITIKPVADVAKKYAQRAQAASPEYQAGVQNPKADWATNSKLAEPAYQAGVQDSISRGAYGKGVTKAGTAKQQAKASTLGVQRYGPGVAAGATDYANGVSPYLETLQRIALPQRGRRGDPANVQRVQAIASALHAQKTGQS